MRLIARDLVRAAAPVLHIEASLKDLGRGGMREVEKIARAHRGRSRVLLYARLRDGNRWMVYELRRMRVAINQELIDQLNNLPDVVSASGPDLSGE